MNSDITLRTASICVSVSEDISTVLFSDKYKISKLIMRPRYDRYRRVAPLKRNEQMVDICDKVLVFWDGISRGTKHTIEYARKIGKPIEVVIINEEK